MPPKILWTVYDFDEGVLHRKSIDDNAMALVSVVNCTRKGLPSPPEWINAQWRAKEARMVYGQRDLGNGKYQHRRISFGTVGVVSQLQCQTSPRSPFAVVRMARLRPTKAIAARWALAARCRIESVDL